MWLLLAGHLAGVVPLHGVWPHLRANYIAAYDAAGTFSCLDGSGTIPLSKFNDNYRDCSDGSDEPGTSDGPPTDFYCQNDGFVARPLGRWSVGDGVCDCCDGSDEFLNPNAHCPNTCAALDREQTELRDSLRRIYEDGHDQLQQLIADGQRKLSSIDGRMRELLQMIPLLERRIKAWRLSPTTPNQKQSLPFWRSFFIRLWRATFWFDDNPFPMELLNENDHKKNLSELGDRLRKLETELEDWQRIAEIAPPPEFAQLFGTTFRAGNVEFSFMKGISKAGKSLGHFKNLSGDVMKFRGGAHCWEKQGERSTVMMTLACGNVNKLVSLKEVSTCQFGAVFATPAACTQDKIAALQEKGLDELRKIRENT
jgi:hypothetical protein